MKTTKKQFDYFVDVCKKYVEYFGLYEWDLTYVHEKIDDHSVASCSTSMPQMSATIRLNYHRDKKNGKLSNEELRITAVHEVGHLLVAKLRCAGETRFLNPDEMNQHDEEIANRIVALTRKLKCI